ncbi:MAG: hypothetical protein JJT89_12305 [Nitriliruptoraceae bacterium]|nr:hypothetical protein [Nitriliruptoraceae bacterium]
MIQDTSRVAGPAQALPVTCAVPEPLGAAVRDWIGASTPWQVVDDELAALVPPAVVLRGVGGGADAAVEPAGRRHPGGPPVIVLVGSDDDPVEVGRAAARWATERLLRWPQERERLPALVDEALADEVPTTAPERVLRVGGAAGGVGTTTVALCLAGLLAWHGERVLVGIRGAGHTPRVVPAAGLAGPGVFARADAVAGLDRCRRVLLVDDDPVPEPSDPELDRLVVDLGVATEADVLVFQPDRAGMAALEATTAGALVCNGPGPIPLARVRAAARGRVVTTLERSARVARAAVADRVPAGVPGRWLAPLHPLAGIGPRARASAAVGAG